ncbi:MAG: hypothetical protein WC986_13790 [Elusimicrobiota bacterium]
MKRLSIAMLLAAMLSLLGSSPALAVNPDTLTLTVSIGNTLSVRFATTGGANLDAYDFGAMLLGQASVNTTAIGIDNDSGGLTESYQLSIGDTGGGLILRTDNAALSFNEYRVRGIFQAAAPSPANFANNDIITGSAVAATDNTTGIFCVDTTTPGGEDGVSVVPNGNTTPEINLWLELELAATGSISGTQTAFATVYINAV